MVMWLYVSLAMLSIAVSLDSCGVGITYGLRKIKIPLTSVFILALCSGSVILIAMILGDYLKPYIPEAFTHYIGAFILIMLGLWIFIQFLLQSTAQEPHALVMDKSKANQEVNQISASTVLQVKLKKLGFVIQILRMPQKADIDQSGTISPSEALMLGIALSLDAFGAGLGASLLSLPIALTTITIMACSAGFVGIGLWLGRKLSHLRLMRYLSGLPGILLIIIGILKLF